MSATAYLLAMVPYSLLTAHSLSGTPIGEKVERANDHRVDLLAELDMFRQRKPYLVRKDLQERDGVRCRVITAHDAERPPYSVALILGDFVHNLRATLDHLVGAMRDDGPSRSSSFPVCRTRDGDKGFDQLSKVKLRGVPKDAVEIIEAMQPYDGIDVRRDWWRAQFRALAWLHKLWEVEKHRTLLLSTAFVRPEYVRGEGPKERAKRVGWEAAIGNNAAEWWLPIDSDEKLDPDFSVVVTLTQPRGFAGDWPEDVSGWPLDGLVNHLYSTVAHHVLPALCQFVQPRW